MTIYKLILLILQMVREVTFAIVNSKKKTEAKELEDETNTNPRDVLRREWMSNDVSDDTDSEMPEDPKA
jgi:hypothetical protein